MKKKVLLIGCGNIGCRHLEGLLKINKFLEISIIEKSKLKLNELVKKLKKNKIKNKKIIISNNLSIKNSKFDLVICATTSFRRYYLLKKLILKFKFNKILIEKLAFQNINEFKKTLIMFEKNNINCWVNCPRREQKIYRKIKIENKKVDKLYLEVSGNRWNLASNSIHFFDLFYFLKNNLIIFNEDKNLLKKIPSKHHNFLELTGKLKLTNKQNFIYLNDQKKNKDIIVKIKTSKYKYYINETKQFVRIYSKNKIFAKKIRLLKQSLLTKKIAEKIINNDQIKLPTLSQAYLPHKLVYSSFKKYFNKKGKVFNCPVT